MSDQSTTTDQPTTSLSSIIVTLLVFMSAVALVRYVMPPLVEEVHYAIERGRQRARFEVASDKLSEDPLENLSSASRLVDQKIAPSVVHIDTERKPTESEAARDAAFGVDPAEDDTVHGQGSGIILTEDGQIITNYHVIQSAEQIRVTLSDDREFAARVVGVDQLTDLALLRIDEAKDLVAAEWGDSDALSRGSMVWAVGSPFGLSKTITFGILSGKARRSFDHEFLQSDAAVSAGNSGGPLVDSTGKVVGINTAIIGPTYQGVSLAIPANRVQQVYRSVLSREKQSEQAWLGVRLSSTPDGEPRGALIDDVLKTFMSPAAAAGIRPGDVVTRWNDTDIKSPTQLRLMVSEAEVNEPVRIAVSRGGQTKSVVLKIGPKPLQF